MCRVSFLLLPVLALLNCIIALKMSLRDPLMKTKDDLNQS